MILNTIQQNFREAMSFCAAGVHVITTDGKAGRYGITIASIYPILLENEYLCVNVLAKHQQDVAEHFAGMTKLMPAKRFEQHIWHRGKTGQLQIEGALAHLHGHIVEHHVMGTHGVFYIHLDEILHHDDEADPLLYFRRQFG